MALSQNGDDVEAMEAFSKVLWTIKDGPISADSAAEYARFRELLLGSPDYADALPPLIRGSGTANEFQDLLAKLETKDSHRINDVLDASSVLKNRAKEVDNARRRQTILDAAQLSAADSDGRFGAGPFGVGTFSGPSGRGTVHQLQGNDLVTGPPEIGSATLEVHDAISATSADHVDLRPAANSSTWTGTTGRAARLIALRTEIEVARDAVGYLIDDLASPDGNCGPLAEEHTDALEALRGLHRALGEILDAMDHGRMADDLGDSFAAEIARFSTDCLASLRDNSARTTIAVTAFATLSACGFPGFAGFLASGLLAVPKGARIRNKAG